MTKSKLVTDGGDLGANVAFVIQKMDELNQANRRQTKQIRQKLVEAVLLHGAGRHKEAGEVVAQAVSMNDERDDRELKIERFFLLLQKGEYKQAAELAASNGNHD